MLKLLQAGLSSHNGFVRKGAIAALRVPKWWSHFHARPDDFRAAPPVLANSFPKSGTHLLFQIVDGLPNATNYGAFLASMTSSFQFRERSPRERQPHSSAASCRAKSSAAICFTTRSNADDLAQKNVVHYFVYRDPRDVVVSEAHYLRDMNRWHRLAPYFRKSARRSTKRSCCRSPASTRRSPGIEYPNIAARFARIPRLAATATIACRFGSKSLASERRPAVIRQMAEFYARHCSSRLDVDACVAAMTARIAPEKSHTFRSGKKAGWQKEFTAEHRRRFDELAGDLLIELGYESNHDWAIEQGAGEHGAWSPQLISARCPSPCSMLPTMRIIVHDYVGHPFQVQLSRELAGRGHDVLHLYCGSFVTPRGELERRDDDPPGFHVRGIALSAVIPKTNFVRRFRLEAEYARALTAECDEFQARSRSFRPTRRRSCSIGWPAGASATACGSSRGFKTSTAWPRIAC